jgi:hypothetical protein
MIKMKFIRNSPGRILGLGEFIPGVEYPLPDIEAKKLIATCDPDWEEVKTKSYQPEDNQSGKPGKGISGKGR